MDDFETLDFDGPMDIDEDIQMYSYPEKLRQAEEQQQRTEALLEQLNVFVDFVHAQRKSKSLEIGRLLKEVKSEHRSISKICRQIDEDSPRDSQVFRRLESSNLPFYEAVWTAAKRSIGVVALRKWFYWTENYDEKVRRRHRSIVDVVSKHGAEWLKVSTLTEHRLLLELEETDQYSSDESEVRSDIGPQGIIKQAEALVKAAQATTVRYRHPSIRFVLPRVRRGRNLRVDQVLEQIEALGIQVETEAAVFHPPEFVDSLRAMTTEPFDLFSNILNIDCTVLLAFVSDLSHHMIPPEEWHDKYIAQQIEIELDDQVLPNMLWPVCGSRSLVCTVEAMIRFNEIVDTIGSESEKARRDCISMNDATRIWSREQRITAFQGLSAYKVPQQWSLPIRVVNVGADDLNTLPPIALRVMEGHTKLNQSVFTYGWAARLTTITSNRGVTKAIESAVETICDTENAVGPDIFLMSTARSLVGKMKRDLGIPDPHR